jgi:hypothetical protein
MRLRLTIPLGAGDEKAMEGRIEGDGIEDVYVAEGAKPTDRLFKLDMGREPVTFAIANQPEQGSIFKTRAPRFRIDLIGRIALQQLLDRKLENARAYFG